jgi:predicted AAA+ superfamily ATPase
MFKRDIENELQQLAADYPIVTVIGPRQSGKTTLNSEFLETIHLFQNLAKERAPKGYLIYAGEQEQMVHSVELINYTHAAQVVRAVSSYTK